MTYILRGHSNLKVCFRLFAYKMSLDRGAWKAIVHGVPESQTRLSDFTSLFSRKMMKMSFNFSR